MANFDKIQELRNHLVGLATTRDPGVGFNMDDWIGDKPSVCDLHEGFCGTSACLAGHVWLLHHPEYRTHADIEREGIDVCQEATELLDLDYEEANHMFYGAWRRTWRMDGVPIHEAIEYLDAVLEAEEVFMDLDEEVG